MKIDFATHDKIVSGMGQDLDRTMLMFSIGGPDLGRRALATAVLSWRALDIKPSTVVVMHFGGYDDDPRELWQIPEVKDFIRKFCEKTKAHKHPALDPISRDLLLACGADPTKHVEVEMISKEEALRRQGEFLSKVMKKDD